MPEIKEWGGFSVSQPIGKWNKSLDVDYPSVFKSLAKATTYYLAGAADVGLPASVDGLFALKLRDRDLGPAELAWDLIRRALARSMSNLTVSALRSHGVEKVPRSAQELVDRLDSALEEVEVWIDPGFFERPDLLPCVDAVKPAFRDWLAECNIPDPEIRSIEDRLGAYLTFALHSVWAEDSDRFTAIEAALIQAETPFGKADARERGWLRNAAHLQQAIYESVFDEAFGLAQIYVPLRAYWSPIRKRLESAGLDHPKTERAKPIVVDLEAELREWLVDCPKADAIRVICGGPGSGKTSFAKMLAANLAGDARYRVLFVSLHDIEYEGDFRQALERYAKRVTQFDFDPLEFSHDERRIVLFLDGLDELAMQGHAGQIAASEFVQHLVTEMRALNRDRLRVQVVLGGREIVVEANENVFRGERQVLHVLPYLVENTEDRHDPSAPKPYDDPQDLLSVDQRDLWWQRYAHVKGRKFAGLPKDLKADSLAEITSQPLLNYLIALSLENGRVKFDENFNLNDLYGDLINEVWQRRWGDERQLPEIDRITRRQFVRIMEEIGLAAWQLGRGG